MLTRDKKVILNINFEIIRNRDFLQWKMQFYVTSTTPTSIGLTLVFPSQSHLLCWPVGPLYGGLVS